MPDSKLTRLVLKNFLASAEGMTNSGMFRHLYVKNETGEESDVLQDGTLSCAYVVSSLLTLYGLLDRPHATVATTLEKMTEAGWTVSSMPRPGAVAYWPEYNGNEHIGIVLDSETYVSNSSDTHTPVKHGPILKNGVKVAKYYVHPTLTGEK